MKEIKENFSSPTPAKAEEPSRVRSIEDVAELPERHGLLVDFFNRMTTSLRLFDLRKRVATFENVSRQVEKLTGRKFTLMHLAQIKFLLPEAVYIDKILVHDETTKCMKPHLKLELIFDVVEDQNEESNFLALRNLFSSRLRDFHIKYPEDYEVPEAALPEQFNRENTKISEDSLSKDFPASSDSEMLNSSHLPPAFKRHFDQNPVPSEIKRTGLLSPTKSVSVVDEEIKGLSSDFVSSTTCTSEITPSKLVSGSTSVMVQTPVQSTPVRPVSPSRSVLTCEDKNKTVISESFKHSSSSAKKSLNFSYEERKDDVTPHEHIFPHLTDLVILIHKVFQSVDFRPITREELFHKIMMDNFEFDDKSEVETQVTRIEKLVPEWLFKKFAPSGDLLYNLKKVADLNAVCERINVAWTLGL